MCPRSIVAPLVGAWIEISSLILSNIGNSVAPLVGAWIEISSGRTHLLTAPSLPSWERGLKYLEQLLISRLSCVAPLVGAWIEIIKLLSCTLCCGSLPSWERGLK